MPIILKSLLTIIFKINNIFYKNERSNTIFLKYFKLKKEKNKTSKINIDTAVIRITFIITLKYKIFI